MPDWSMLIREKLGRLGLAPAQREEIVAELAAHLEDVCEARRALGRNESEAIDDALDEVGNWGRLSKKIQRAKQEDNMNERTRTLWLPGLASLTAAMAFLMILQLAGVQPRFIWMRSGPPLELYTSWIVAQPLFGALGAYLSRRGGGQRRACLAAGLFPSMTMLGLFFVGGTLSFFASRHGRISMLAMLAQVFIWIVLPALALLIGALPFLKAQKLRAA